MIQRAEIERRLKLPLATVAMATLSKEDGTLARAKDQLLDAVEKIVRDAERRQHRP